MVILSHRPLLVSLALLAATSGKLHSRNNSPATQEHQYHIILEAGQLQRSDPSPTGYSAVTSFELLAYGDCLADAQHRGAHVHGAPTLKVCAPKQHLFQLLLITCINQPEFNQ
jgi:hypothetical protein